MMGSSTTLTVSQYINSVSQQTMALASGWSSAAQQFVQAVAAEGGAAVVSAERQFQLLAQSMSTQFSQLAAQSQTWAAAAEAQGNHGIAEIMNRYSAKYAAQANALLDPVLSAEARVAALAAEARTGVLAAEGSFGGTFGRAVGPAFDAFQLTQGALNWGDTGDSTAFGQAAVGVALSWGAGIVFGAGAVALGAGAFGVALAAGIAAGAGAYLGNDVFDLIDDVSRSHPEFWDFFYGNTALGKGLGKVFVEVADFFGLSQRIVPRRDPLTLDLDGDGLETVGVAAGVLFDHDGDGVRSGTGWVSGDDGFLVLDRNTNGQIDSGRELFGDSTPLASGGTALDGFAALAQEDTNADGRVDSLDANWSNLRVWRDLNQDGVSQSGELFTLGSLGIAALNVAVTEHTQTLPNGNQVADLGSYVRSDGSTGTLAQTGQMADVNLADDTFHRQFTDTVPLTPEAQGLPDMQGSGLVRDLREAASQSGTLAGLLAQYAAAPTRAAQLALLDQLLDAWADTSTLAERLEERTTQYRFRYMGFGSARRSDYLLPGETGGSGPVDYDATYIALPEDLDNPRLESDYKALIATWNQRIHTLEAFNGRYFFSLPEQTQTGLSALEGINERTGENYYEVTGGVGTLMISYSQGQLDLLNQSYEALRESVYSALIVQTRFAGLLDQVQLVIDENGIRFDFAAVTQAFQDRIAANAAQGMSDLIEFNRHAGNMLRGMGWEGLAMMEGYMRTLLIGAELQAVYDEFHVSVEGMTGFTGIGSKADEIIVAGAGVNNLHGGEGNDTILGGADNDNVFGNNGNDLLDGGTGNDYLEGGAGSDTYVFSRGSGQDAISNNDTSTGKTDTLEFGADILPSDIVMTRSSTNLLLTIAGTTDTATVRYFFDNDGNSSYGLEQVRFADGTIWSKTAIKLMAIAGNDTAQDLRGYATADVINGLGGNDVILGGDGNDTIDGGDGADSLNGNNGNDVIYGGAGNDTVYAGSGNDLLDGGIGNDYLQGDSGSDTYVFERGSGQDVISNYDTGTDKTDALEFGADVLPADIMFARSGLDLVLSIAGTTDRVTVKSFFDGDGNSGYALEQVKFANGTIWNKATVLAMFLQGTSGADNIVGTANNDSISAEGGNDVILGGDGNDTIDGGDGADSLNGNNGNDVIYGGSGNDTVYAGSGNDRLDGGTGNDYLQGDSGSDTYVFERGSGQDVVSNYDTGTGKTDALEFGADILPGDIAITRSGTDLVLTIAGTTDRVTVKSFFDTDGNSGYALEQVRFADGTTWDKAAVKLLAIAGNDTAQDLRGYATADVINGLGGNDVILGGDGNDTIDGGDGADSLNGNNGNDVIYGGAGNDTVYAGSGNDRLDGGTGNDYLQGDAGSDTYVFSRGSGQDVVNNYDTSTGKTDTLEFGADILPADIVMTRSGTDLLLAIAGTTDKVTVRSFFDTDGNGAYALEQVRFADGTTWDKATVKLLAIAGNDTAQNLRGYATADVINGLGGNDVISGGSGNDTIDGGDGADSLNGDNGDDVVYGGSGNDTVYAGSGNDRLDGGTGSDVLVGGVGNDNYWLARGYGNDTIQENDATAGNADVARFDTGIAVDQFWFRHVGNNLEVSIIGTADKFTLQNWYSGSAYHVEQFRTVDNRLLLDGQVENLVQAMAAFSPPASGQTTLPQNYQDALNPVIAANWQ